LSISREQDIVPLNIINQLEEMFKVSSLGQTQEVVETAKSLEGLVEYRRRIAVGPNNMSQRAKLLTDDMFRRFKTNVPENLNASETVDEFQSAYTLWIFIEFLSSQLSVSLRIPGVIELLLEEEEGVTVVESLIREKKPDDRLYRIFELEIPDFSQESWKAWLRSICDSTMDQSVRSPDEWYNYLLKWKKPKRALKRFFERRNMIAAREITRVVNSSIDMTELIIRELMITDELYKLAQVINANMDFSFWNGSYVARRLLLPWGINSISTNLNNIIILF